MMEEGNSRLRRAFSFDSLFEFLFIIIILIASYHSLQLKLFITEDIGDHGFSVFKGVASHNYMKPWQYRILLPEAANVLLRLHLPFLNSLERIWKCMEFGSLFLLVLVFRYFLSFFVQNRVASALFSFLILVVLPFNIFLPRPFYAFYYFDTPAMLFFVLGLMLIYMKKWAWYYLLFIIATLNRETSCYLTMVYLFVSIGKERINNILFHCMAQFVIWVSIKAILFYLYFDNPGPVEGFEIYDDSSVSHLMDNINYLTNPKNIPFILSHMGYIWLFAFMGFRFIRDDFIKRSLLIIFPYFAGMMIVANIYELRIFCELIPLFLIAFALVIKETLGDGARQCDPSEG